jgi:branched-chain amino acid transport system substrate-binding protein
MLRSRFGRAVAAACVLAMLASACGDDDDSETTSPDTTAAADGGGTTTTAADGAPSTEGFAVPEETGPADDSLEPVKIGFVNQSEGTPSFPGPNTAAQAAVDYINEKLGGIDGHPVELVECVTGLDPDSNQQCAQQMVNDDSIGIVTTQFVLASDAFWPVMEQSDLVALQGTPLGVADFTSSAAISFTPGGPGIIIGLASYAVERLGATSLAPIAADNAGGQASVQLMQSAPQLADIEITPVVVGETETDVAGALQAVEADAYVIIAPANTCIQVARALDQIDSDTPVLGVSSCADPAVIAEVDDLVTGWISGGPGSLPGLPSGTDPELDRYLEIMDAAGLADDASLTAAPQTFGQLLTLWQVGNEIGYDGLDRAGWKAGLLEFQGPVFLGPRSTSCPGAAFPALCTTEARLLEIMGGGKLSDPVPGPFDPYKD